jgi:tetratricopeptide (TPR) repeat protein
LEDAAHAYLTATKIDSMNAAAFFKLGTCLYSLSRFHEAKDALIRAKDLDALRFRATEEFQDELTKMCSQHSVPMARVDSAFISHSPHGILDDSLFLEHLHPNVSGYFLMAKSFCRAIEQNHLLVPSSDWRHTEEPADSVLMELSCVTEFDRTVGKVKIDLLKRRWPFVTGSVNYEFVAANSVESVVFRMMKGGIAWSDARYLLAEFYARNKQFDLARKECLAVSKVIPFVYEPLLRNADYFSQEGKREEAKNAYEVCFTTDDNPFARMKYAVLLLEDEQASAAAAQIEIAITIHEKGKYKLPIQGVATSRYLLGVAYAKLRKFDSAKENLQRALAIEPGYKEAAELLK